MTFNGWIQIAIYCAIIIAITKPFGGYIARVFNGERTFLSPVLGPLERGFYGLSGVDPDEEQHWLTYAFAMLMFSIVGFVVLYAIQRLQGVLPFNPQHLPAESPDLSFNTSISFISNTNWQSYVPETTMSYFTEMAGLAWHNFTSAAVGIGVALVVARAAKSG